MQKIKFNAFKPLDYGCKEALNTLCTNLAFAGSDVKKIMLTSCQPSEGKSFIAMNLMRSLAGLGKQVVLVDADIRNSVMEGHYGVKGLGSMGLAHYLSGHCDMEEILYQTDVPGAYLVSVGKNVANSLTLLNTRRLPDLLDALAEEFDAVIIDTAPVGVIIDAAVIAKACDGVIFVVESNKVSRYVLSAACAQIEKTGTPILGAVLNGVDETRHSGGYAYKPRYASGYDTDDDFRRPNTSRRTAKRATR